MPLDSIKGIPKIYRKVTKFYIFPKYLVRQTVGGGRVVCILRQRDVQLILAYSWAKPAILVAVRVEGASFYFFCFFTFISVPLSSLSLSFLSSTISCVSFLPFSGRWHKMTHKGWRVVKPQYNQSTSKSRTENTKLPIWVDKKSFWQRICFPMKTRFFCCCCWVIIVANLQHITVSFFRLKLIL